MDHVVDQRASRIDLCQRGRVALATLFDHSLGERTGRRMGPQQARVRLTQVNALLVGPSILQVKQVHLPTGFENRRRPRFRTAPIRNRGGKRHRDEHNAGLPFGVGKAKHATAVARCRIGIERSHARSLSTEGAFAQAVRHQDRGLPQVSCGGRDARGRKKRLPGWGCSSFKGSSGGEAVAVRREENPAREPTSSRLRVHATRTLL